MPRLPVDRRPAADELAAVEAGLPAQPRHVAVALSGEREPAGWWGTGRAETWADAVEAARVVARAVVAPLEVRQAEARRGIPAGAPSWSSTTSSSVMPVSCTRGWCRARPAGAHVGDGDRPRPGPRCRGHRRRRRALSTFPVATQDVALVVDSGVPAATVEAALREGAGTLLESVRLFDVYEGAQVGEGKKSLAYALRFRAPDRTLTVEESTAARDAAVALATERTGAVLRG